MQGNPFLYLYMCTVINDFTVTNFFLRRLIYFMCVMVWSEAKDQIMLTAVKAGGSREWGTV